MYGGLLPGPYTENKLARVREQEILHRIDRGETWPSQSVTFCQLLASVSRGPRGDSKLRNDNKMIRQFGHASLNYIAKSWWPREDTTKQTNILSIETNLIVEFDCVILMSKL